MAIHFIANEQHAAFYNSGTMTAFGLVISGNAKHYFDPAEVADIVLNHIGTKFSGMDDAEATHAIEKALAWIEEQPEGPDAGDLAHTARTGQVRCPDCADWTDDESPKRQGTRCAECYDELLKEEAAEQKGDMMREEA